MAIMEEVGPEEVDQLSREEEEKEKVASV